MSVNTTDRIAFSDSIHVTMSTLSVLMLIKVDPRGWVRMSTKVDNKGQSAVMSCMCRQ